LGAEFAIVHRDGSLSDARLWKSLLGDDFPDELRSAGGAGSGSVARLEALVR
jgi:hypothetical protein